MAEEVTKKTEAPVAETADQKTAKPKVSKRKKVRRSVPSGQLHVQATFNNTIITITDKKGNVLVQSSAGACGFQGSKKGTAYAAQVACEKAAEIAKTNHGLSAVDVFVNGVGLGRDSAIRSLVNLGIRIDSIKDTTGIPHGGVRPRKERRG